MKEKKKNYLLYINENQDSLIAIAHSEDELHEISKDYENGVWFEYDVLEKKDHLDTLLNERLFSSEVNFAKKIRKKKKPKEEKEEKEEIMLNSEMGDLR